MKSYLQSSVLCLTVLATLFVSNPSRGFEITLPGVYYLTSEVPIFVQGYLRDRSRDPSVGNYAHFGSIYVNLVQQVGIVRAYAIVPNDSGGFIIDNDSTGIHVDHARNSVNRYLRQKRLNERAGTKLTGRWIVGLDITSYDDEIRDIGYGMYDMTFRVR